MIAEAFSLDTAEGRTHALSAIQEQWNQLPEGHFKQQMTYEIAGWVQMPIQDLQFLLTQPPPSFKRTSQTKNDVPYQNADRQTNRKKKQLDSFQRTYRTPNTHLSNIEQRLLLAVMAFPEQALRHTALQDFYRWCEELEELPETLNALTLLGAYLDNEGASDTVVLRTRLIENGMASLLDRLPVSPEQWHHLSQPESLKYVES
jgi:DNA primase